MSAATEKPSDISSENMKQGGEQEKQSKAIVMRYWPAKSLPFKYHNFIKSKWMRSFRFGNDYIKLSDADSYFAAYSRYIEALLGRLDVCARVAVLDDDIDVALGFSIIQNASALHYVYVHKDARKMGVGRALIPHKISTITHLTKTGLKLWPTKLPKAIFNPFYY
jgi:GNAT superfamily N-acetyltransferase